MATKSIYSIYTPFLSTSARPTNNTNRRDVAAGQIRKEVLAVAKGVLKTVKKDKHKGNKDIFDLGIIVVPVAYTSDVS